MAKRSASENPERTRVQLIELLEEAPGHLASEDIGVQVNCLVEINTHLRQLGASIGSALAGNEGGSGRARMLGYLRYQVGKVVHTDELMIVAGIGDYPRRIRELRTDFGWPILSGLAVRDLLMGARDESADEYLKFGFMVPEEYILIEDRCDIDAIRRWALAPSIRASLADPLSRLESYLTQSPDQRVTAEELRNVSGNDPSWPEMLFRLQRDGMPIRSRFFGDTDVPAGIFIFQK